MSLGWVKDWQTLVAATVALIAAVVAFHNTSRSLRDAERLEAHRRHRKRNAVRAVLPLALAQVTEYAERSARALVELAKRCSPGPTLPQGLAPESIIQALPAETLATLAEFIEYSDVVNCRIVEQTVAWIQIHDARVGDIFERNCDPSDEPDVVRKEEIEARIIDAASIYAGAAAVFEYARQQQEQLPVDLSWDAVRGALRSMRLWDEDHPELYVIVDGRETKTTGPFERLRDVTMPADRSEHERALERDAIQFTKDFSLFVLRTCVILHGGAILALLTLLGTMITHQMFPSSSIISLTAVRIAIGIFAVGLVSVVVAGICGYFNFLLGQTRDVPAEQLAQNMTSMSRSRRWATILTIISLVLFIVGVAIVVLPN
jgi:hypothetical protein